MCGLSSAFKKKNPFGPDPNTISQENSYWGWLNSDIIWKQLKFIKGITQQSYSGTESSPKVVKQAY